MEKAVGVLDIGIGGEGERDSRVVITTDEGDLDLELIDSQIDEISRMLAAETEKLKELDVEIIETCGAPTLNSGKLVDRTSILQTGLGYKLEESRLWRITQKLILSVLQNCIKRI